MPRTPNDRPIDPCETRVARRGGNLLQDQVAYPPRLLRAESAARYLGMGTRTFLRLVAEGKLPKPKRIGGMVAWDRYRLDAFVDDSDDDVIDNTVDQLLRDF